MKKCTKGQEFTKQVNGIEFINTFLQVALVMFFSVTMVNQDHLNSVIQFALDRTEQGNTVACITAHYHTLSIQSNWNRTRVLWHLPFYLVTVVAVEVLPLVLLFLFTVVVLLLLHCCVVVL